MSTQFLWFADPTPNSEHAVDLPIIGSLLVLCACIWKLFNNWRKLSHVPGPSLTGLSDFWRAWHQYNGTLRTKLIDLHEQYGTVVRYGVTSVSFTDPRVIDVMYGNRFVIADSYKVLLGISNGKEVSSLVSTADGARHAALRRSIAGAFAPKGVADYEPHIVESILELRKLLDNAAPGTVDLSTIMVYFSMDTASRTAFGTSIGCMATNSDVEGSIRTIQNRFVHWGVWSSLPWLERLIYRDPIAMRSPRAPSAIVKKAVAMMQAHIAKQDVKTETSNLLAKYWQASKANPTVLDKPGVIGMLMSTLSGATDTTATTTTATIFYLLKQPKTLAGLKRELAAAMLDTPVPTHEQVAKLPYLNAVIKEAMRPYSVLTWPMEQLVPSGGASLAGFALPEKTSIGCLPAALHLNWEIFGKDVHAFRLERWLVEDKGRLRTMEAAHMGFSRGRRVCIGQHVAMRQMKMVIPTLVVNFEITLVDDAQELKGNFQPAVVCLNAMPVVIKRRT